MSRPNGLPTARELRINLTGLFLAIGPAVAGSAYLRTTCENPFTHAFAKMVGLLLVTSVIVGLLIRPRPSRVTSSGLRSAGLPWRRREVRWEDMTELVFEPFVRTRWHLFRRKTGAGAWRLVTPGRAALLRLGTTQGPVYLEPDPRLASLILERRSDLPAKIEDLPSEDSRLRLATARNLDQLIAAPAVLAALGLADLLSVPARLVVGVVLVGPLLVLPRLLPRLRRSTPGSRLAGLIPVEGDDPKTGEPARIIAPGAQPLRLFTRWVAALGPVIFLLSFVVAVMNLQLATLAAARKHPGGSLGKIEPTPVVSSTFRMGELDVRVPARLASYCVEVERGLRCEGPRGTVILERSSGFAGVVGPGALIEMTADNPDRIKLLQRPDHLATQSFAAALRRAAEEDTGAVVLRGAEDGALVLTILGSRSGGIVFSRNVALDVGATGEEAGRAAFVELLSTVEVVQGPPAVCQLFEPRRRGRSPR